MNVGFHAGVSFIKLFAEGAIINEIAELINY